MFSTPDKFEALICQRCGLGLGDKPRFSFQEQLYCFRCAKEVTKRSEGVQYQENLLLQQKQDAFNNKIRMEYEEMISEWEKQRKRWIAQNSIGCGQLFFWYGCAFFICYLIHPILLATGITMALPIGHIITEKRERNISAQFIQRNPRPPYPSYINSKLPRLEHHPDLTIVLSAEEWAVTRKVPREHILNRDRMICQSCGQPKVSSDLEVHHIIPRVLYRSDCDANLISLCKFCHDHEYWFGHVRSYPTTFAKPNPKKRRRV